MNKRQKFLTEEIELEKELMKELREKLEKEQRARTEDERKEMEERKAKIQDMQEELKDLEEEQRQAKEDAKKNSEARKAAAAAGQGASQGEEREAASISKKVSLGKAVNDLVHERSATGAEKEMHEIAESESGEEYRGIAIPSSWIETRADIDQTTSDIKPTMVSNEYVEALREVAVYELVGATVYNGLTGDFKIPVVTKQSVAHASAENAASSDGGSNFDNPTLSPSRITGHADYSNRLTIQNGDIAMRAIMTDFGAAVGETINDAMFATTTVTNAPTSIAATSGVGTFTEATYTANASILADFVTAEVTLAEAEALTGNVAYVGAPNLLADLKKSAQVASVTPAMVGNTYNQQVINGYRTYFTTGATSSAGVSGDFIFGNFRKVHVGYFGALNILIDPYTQATSDQTRLVIHRHYDFKLVQGGAFVKATSLIA